MVSNWRVAAAVGIAVFALVVGSGVLRSQDEMETDLSKVRAMWIWNTESLFTPVQLAKFVTAAKAANISDVYLYLRADSYVKNEPQLNVLLAALSAAGIRAWGMEGWRGYFADEAGPEGLYAAAGALVAFNRRNEVKFVGFHSDLEPQDGQGSGENRFHNEIAQSNLTPTQLKDRDQLMIEWLTMHKTLLGMMKAAELQYGGAMPAWIDDYFGEPVRAVFEGKRKPVIEHLMPLLEQYVIMSYDTNPTELIGRIAGELKYAAALGDIPHVMFGVETHAGVGRNISYADTPLKNNRRTVRADLSAIEAKLSSAYPNSYLGWAIHDWEGWRDLR